MPQIWEIYCLFHGAQLKYVPRQGTVEHTHTYSKNVYKNAYYCFPLDKVMLHKNFNQNNLCYKSSGVFQKAKGIL